MGEVEMEENESNEAKRKRLSLSPTLLRQPDPDEYIVIITPTGDKLFNNPNKVTKAIESSDINRLIVPDETRVLGIGKGLSVKVKKCNVAEIEGITNMGEFEVKCRVPRSQLVGITYGFIGPFEAGANLVDLKAEMKVLHSSSKILQLMKVCTNNIRTFIKIQFEGPLPPKVAVGHVVYNTREYLWPVIRCQKCHMYGHGTISCRNKPRCPNCSTTHIKEQGKPCTNRTFCYMCNGAHKVTDRACPKRLEANEIMKNNSLNYSEQTRQLAALNPKKTPLKPKEPKTFKPQLRGKEKYSEIVTQNRFRPITPVEPTEHVHEEEDEELAVAETESKGSAQTTRKPKPKKPGPSKFHQNPNDLHIIDELDSNNIMENLVNSFKKCSTDSERKKSTRTFERDRKEYTNQTATSSTEYEGKNSKIMNMIKIVIKGLTMYLNGNSINDIIVGLVSDIFEILQ